MHGVGCWAQPSMPAECLHQRPTRLLIRSVPLPRPARNPPNIRGAASTRAGRLDGRPRRGQRPPRAGAQPPLFALQLVLRHPQLPDNPLHPPPDRLSALSALSIPRARAPPCGQPRTARGRRAGHPPTSPLGPPLTRRRAASSTPRTLLRAACRAESFSKVCSTRLPPWRSAARGLLRAARARAARSSRLLPSPVGPVLTSDPTHRLQPRRAVRAARVLRCLGANGTRGRGGVGSSAAL